MVLVGPSSGGPGTPTFAYEHHSFGGPVTGSVTATPGRLAACRTQSNEYRRDRPMHKVSIGAASRRILCSKDHAFSTSAARQLASEFQTTRATPSSRPAALNSGRRSSATDDAHSRLSSFGRGRAHRRTRVARPRLGALVRRSAWLHPSAEVPFGAVASAGATWSNASTRSGAAPVNDWFRSVHGRHYYEAITRGPS